MRQEIEIRLQVEGTHRWPGCDIDEVRFLKDEHRHVFFIDCRKAVSHGDREIEIVCFKRRVAGFLKGKYSGGDEVCRFGSMSCENIAKELLEEFGLSSCRVLEDGENGAVVSA